MHQYFKNYENLGFVDGKHLVIWNDTEDLLKKIDYWLQPENEDRRKTIALEGQRFCLELHSFEVRVQELLQMLKEFN